MRLTSNGFLRLTLLLLPILQSCVSQNGVVVTGSIVTAPSTVTLVSPISSPNTVKQPTFKVDGVSANHTVRIFSDSSCQTEVGSQISSSTSVSITSNLLSFGTNTIYANATNTAGTASACSTSFVTYQLRSNPSLSDLRDKVLDEDDELIVPFNALDEDDPSFGCSSVRASSTNVSLLPLSSIFITGSGTSCSLKLRPLKDQFGEASVTILAKDETTEVTKSLKLTVNPVPDAPSIVLSKLALTFLEDAPSEQIILTISDPDPESIMNCSQISFIPSSIVDVAVSGSAPSCVATITPKLNQSGPGTILFTVNNGLSDSESLGITISPLIDPPQITLSKNSLTMVEDQSSETINVTVFDPDSIISCSQLSLSSSTLVNSVSGGSAPNCTLRFTPKLNQHGSENLSVIFKNDLEVMAPFSITVTPVDDAPVLSLSKNSLSFTEDDEAAPLLITLFDVDSDVSCSQVSVSGSTNLLDPLSIPSTSSPCNLSLKPKLDTYGNGQLSFTVNNGKSDSKELIFSISEVIDAPTISLQSPSLSFKEDDGEQFVLVTISDKDSEINCTKLSVTSSENFLELGIPSPMPGGSASSLDCKISVAPKPDLNGNGLLTFTVKTDLEASAELSFNISNVNDAPTIEIITNTLSFKEDESGKLVSLKIDDKDSPVSCSDVTVSPNSLLTASAITGADKNCSLTLTPIKDKHGMVDLSFIVSNGLEGKATLNVKVESVDDAPEISISNNSLSFAEDGALQQVQITLSDIDSEVNCSQVSASSSDLVSSSLLVTTGKICAVDITPKENQNGPGDVVFTVNNGLIATTKLSFEISSFDDAPKIELSSSPLNFVEDGALQTIQLSLSDVDSEVNCSQLSVVSTDHVTTQRLTSSGKLCDVSVKPNAEKHGEGEISFTVTNSKSFTQKLAYKVNPVDDAPVISLDKLSLSFSEDGIAQTVKISISDVDDETLNCSNVRVLENSLVSLGAVNVSGSDCSVSVTPVKDLDGSSTLTFKVSNTLSSEALLNFNIDPVDDAPVAVAVSGTLTEDVSGLITLSYTDIEGDKASVCTLSNLTNLSGTCSCDTAGVCKASVTGSPNYSGAASFSYTVTANGKTSNAATASLIITGADDAPVAVAVAGTLTEDIPGSINLSYSDLEEDKASECTLSSLTNLSGACSCDTAGVCKASVTGTSNFNGDASFSYTVTANGKASNSAIASVTITPVDDAPVAASVSGTLIEDISGIVNLSYTDPDGDKASVCTLSSLSNLTGTCSCDTSGFCKASVTGSPDYSGAASFSYTVTANGKASNSASASLTITAVPEVPVAYPVSGTLTEDISGLITLSYTDPEGDKASVCTLSSISNLSGTCSCDSLGVCKANVKGNSNFNGNASFSYTVTANGEVSNTAIASVTITAVDDAPVAEAVSGTLTEDIPGLITLSYTDIEGDKASICTLSSQNNLSGTCSCDTAGVCKASVIGSANYSGGASFSYTVTANGKASNAAIASVTITPVDDAPVAVPVSGTLIEDISGSINLSYSDIEGDKASGCTLSSLSNLTGTCSCDTAGLCKASVTGSANYSGVASFSYTVTANGKASNSASASLTITAVPEPPVAAPVSAILAEDISGLIPLSYADPEGDKASVCTLSSLTNLSGSCSCDTSGVCKASVTGSQNFNGAASFSYTVTANGEASNTAIASITITPVDDAPVAASVSGTLTEDIPGSINLSYSDIEGDIASSCSLTFPASSNLTGTCACPLGACQASISVSSNFNGNASFSYTVTANGKASNLAAASVTINPVDDAPVAVAVSGTLTEDIAGSINLSYSDIEGDKASVCSLSSLTNLSGTCSCDTSGVCKANVTGSSNFNGSASFNYTVTANGKPSNSAAASVTINPVDDAPVAAPVSGTLTEDIPGLITLSYTDPDGDKASVCTLSNLTNLSGTCSCDTAGVCKASVTTVAITSNRIASFSYTVTANGEVSNSANASITVSANTPVLSYSVTNEKVGNSVSISPTINHRGATATCSAITTPALPAGLSINSACLISGVPTAVSSGSYTVTATNSAGSSTASASITISANTPVIAYSSTSWKVGDSVSISPNISHRGATATCSAITTPALPAGLSINSACLISGVPTAVSSGSYTVTASNSAGSSTASASINITANTPILSYSSTSWKVGDSVSITPTINHRGATATCSATTTPALPAGLSINSSCLISGVPTAVSSGSYTVTASNSAGSSTASASISVIDNAPIAKAVSGTLAEDISGLISLDYTDPNGDKASECTVSNLNNLTLINCSCDSTGACKANVKGNSNFNGAASFSYTVTAKGLTSNTASASITVTPVDDDPIISALPLALSFLEDSPFQILSIDISDPDVSTSSCSQLSVTSIYGLVSVEKTGTTSPCSIKVTPLLNKSGSDQLLFTFNNGKTISTTITANIIEVPDAPTIKVSPTSLSFVEDGAAQDVSVTISDVDSNVSCTQQVSLTSGSNVSATISGTAPNCVATIKPLKDKDKNETITLTINNGLKGDASLDIKITPVDDNPTISVSPTSLAFSYNGGAETVVAELKDVDSPVDCATQIVLPTSSFVNVSRNGCVMTITPKLNQVGSSILNFSVNTPSGLAISASVNFSIAVGTPVVTYASATGKVGVSFSHSPSSLNNGGSPIESCTGSLPAGLNINSSCQISGVPTTAGSGDYTITAGNGAKTSTTKVSITINPNTPIVSYSSSSGVFGVPMSIPAVVDARGAAVTCSASSLPSGLNIIPSTCEISGTPTAVGSGMYTVSASNSASNISGGPTTTQVSITITANKPLLSYTSQTSGVSSSSIQGRVGTPLGPISPTVLDGRGSAVSCSSNNLPAGLSVDPTTCKISGTPTAQFYSSSTITAVNSVDNTSATLSISIIPGIPVLRYSGSLTGTVGQLVSIKPSLDKKGGELRECKSSTALPSGLSIDGTDCRVYGTPQIAIKGTYTITAKNDGGTSENATLYIGIEAPAYDCIANGFTGPSGTVTSVSSCYMDCNSKNLCGGTTYGHNGCYDKTSVYTGKTCGNYAVGWESKTCSRCAEATNSGFGEPYYEGYSNFYPCSTLPCNESTPPPWYAANCASDLMGKSHIVSCSGPEFVGGNQWRCACVLKTWQDSICLRNENYDCSDWIYEYKCIDNYELKCL